MLIIARFFDIWTLCMDTDLMIRGINIYYSIPLMIIDIIIIWEYIIDEGRWIYSYPS